MPEGRPVRPRERFLVFGSPLIEEAEILEVMDTLRSGWLGTGPKVHRFEEHFKAYKGSAHAAALSSCTAALHLSLLASGVGEGDEVLVPAMTFCATANAVMHAGATPVMVDCDALTMNIDPAAAAAAITPRTRAMVPVHFAGRPCDMNALMATAETHGLTVVEDCAHAIETEYHGRKAGTFGDMGCFSFYVTKNIITGEGGMVISESDEIINRIKVLGLHGMSKDAWGRFSDDGYRHYQVQHVGYKYNMMDLQAAIGLHQLDRVERLWRRREQVWQRYNEALADLPLDLPAAVEPGTRHAYHLYTVLVREQAAGVSRDQFLTGMQKQNIGVGVHYLSLAEHPVYQRRLKVKPEDYPNALAVGQRTVSLPLSARLTDGDVDDVIEAARRVLEGGGA